MSLQMESGTQSAVRCTEGSGTGTGTWLLTGGAGYVGSHIARALAATGRKVVVLDDLSTGRRDRLAGVPLIAASVLQDATATAALLTAYNVTGVIHLAAKKAVDESARRPIFYYEQNVAGTASLMRAAVLAGVSRMIYSSSAAVYGPAPDGPIGEDVDPRPQSPYGESKLAAEWLVGAAAKAHGMAWTSLRYFNVAGAADAVLADRGVANLLPVALTRAMSGDPVEVFGDDWPTPDGSCVRDYVHVEDLAEAHCAAVEAMESCGEGAGVLNVGRGRGASVFEMLDAVAKHSRREVRRVVAGRRPGDVASVVADVARIRQRLGWQASRDLDDIVSSSVRAWVPAAASAALPVEPGVLI